VPHPDAITKKAKVLQAGFHWKAETNYLRVEMEVHASSLFVMITALFFPISIPIPTLE
jgi:hypothetical protein